MFQYTHELVFNSFTMDDGTSRLVVPAQVGDAPLVIKRGGEYWGNFIQNKTVYKTTGYEGVYEIMKLDVTKLANIFPGDSFMAPGTYQLNLFVKLLDPHALYEFGYPNWNSFGRQILIGFDVESSDSAADIAAKIYESLDMAVRREEFKVGGFDAENEAVVDFEEGDTAVYMRANHYALQFDTVGIARYDETMCDSCLGEYIDSVSLLDREDEDAPASIAVEGKQPFATGQWLVENLRFPTYPNIRYWGVGDQDRPIPGVIYVQYSFAYESPRPQLGGLSGVGQAMTAITRHVYYVPQSLASAFEAGFAGIGVSVVATDQIEVTNPDTPVVSGNDNG